MYTIWFRMVGRSEAIKVTVANYENAANLWDYLAKEYLMMSSRP